MGRGRRGRRQRWRWGTGGRSPLPWGFVFGLFLGATVVVAVMFARGWLPPGGGASRDAALLPRASNDVASRVDSGDSALEPADPGTKPIDSQIGATNPRIDAVNPQVDTVNLVSDVYPSALAGDPGWDLHRTLRADLNRDGRDETVHVIARVTRAGPGPNEFMWDDGHVWIVYIEDDAGHATPVFRGWVQLGELRVRSLDPFSDGGGPGLLLILDEGAGITLYRVTYDGPDEFTTEKIAGVLTWSEAR